MGTVATLVVGRLGIVSVIVHRSKVVVDDDERGMKDVDSWDLL